jgi:hypothetical protein
MTHGTPQPGRPAEPDEIDRLFSAYFQLQVPRHWPAFEPGPSAEPAWRRSAAAGRSRATLAVSVAALLGLGLYLSSGPRPLPTGNESHPVGSGLLKDATAKGPNLPKRLIEAPESEKGPRTP